jgi:hypothetical protein
LQAELEREVRLEACVQGEGGASADGEIERGLLAIFIDLRRMAIHGRQVVEARPEKVLEALRRAIDETTSQRAQLQAAKAQLP